MYRPAGDQPGGDGDEAHDDNAVTDFPEPLSADDAEAYPPGFTDRLTPPTAAVDATPLTWNWVSRAVEGGSGCPSALLRAPGGLRSCATSVAGRGRFSATRFQPRVERVAQRRRPSEVDRHDDDQDHQARHDGRCAGWVMSAERASPSMEPRSATAAASRGRGRTGRRFPGSSSPRSWNIAMTMTGMNVGQDLGQDDPRVRHAKTRRAASTNSLCAMPTVMPLMLRAKKTGC